MAAILPPIGAKGIYELDAPFTTLPTVTYTCKAIRTFDDIYKLNRDPFADYYTPLSISQERFELDKANGVCIITLIANDIGIETDDDSADTIIYVPSSFILKFPDGNNVIYSHIVLSVSLGPLPDYMELSDVRTDIADLVSAKVGVVPVVSIHKASMSGSMTQADADTAELGRQAGISDMETDYTRLRNLQLLYAALLDRYNTLEAAYIDVAGP